MLAFALAASAHAAPAVAPLPSFEALLVRADGTSEKAFIVTATKASVRYRESKDTPEIKDRKVSDFAVIRVVEPHDYAVALDLYQARRYQEAKKAFSVLKVALEPVSTLPDNPATLSAFYELECLRKLGDLDGLAEGLKKFNKDTLVRENHLRQLEMYLFWDAVRTKNWQRVEALVKDRQKQRLPGDQRAQVSYCHALALEALGKIPEALDAYNAAMTADLGASEEIARSSALAILRVRAADPEVREALKHDDPAAPGHTKLMEAQAVARMFQLSVGAGEALPDEYRIFMK